MRQLPSLWFVLHVACVLCGAQAAHLELTPPRMLPARWPRWDTATQKACAENRDPCSWWLIVESELHANGAGQNVHPDDVVRLQQAFGYPRSHARIRRAGIPGDAGFCSRCDVPYCPRHWDGEPGRGAVCPRGHTR